tara:strand:- start:1568 stop:1738 length:171 start_codon:yes stop_codon:yes gene_type:complete
LEKIRKGITFATHCGVEQLVARRAHNPKAVGSSPAPATKKVSKSLVNRRIARDFVL